ncbi:NAD(P)-dependent oxidoreductase [Paraburkholderia oxyphila]|uniref:NAD(P)-dependent oxidoreductase n=1 Tax=Paraburkholderia oxyphila TaxID=614212 RepID=UPI0006941992|nr:NAD(P)-binding domain-containing protein [Paraburkholderia oxyphila]
MTDSGRHSDITILGLGAMGSAYAREFLKAGKHVTVWNRTPSKADSLVRDGAFLAPDAKTAMAASPVTILALVDHDSIRDILSDDVLAASTDRTLIDLTTGTEAEFKEIAARTRDAGISFLAGGVLAYPRSVGSADTAVFCSGDATVFEESRDLLRHIGGTQHYVSTDPALGLRVFLALALMGFVTIGGFFEAAAFAESCGVSVATMAEYVRTSGQPWTNECIDYLSKRISSGSDDGDQAIIDVYVDGFKAVLSDLQGAGVGSRSLGAIVDYVKIAQTTGLGSKGLAAVYDVVRNNLP